MLEAVECRLSILYSKVVCCQDAATVHTRVQCNEHAIGLNQGIFVDSFGVGDSDSSSFRHNKFTNMNECFLHYPDKGPSEMGR